MKFRELLNKIKCPENPKWDNHASYDDFQHELGFYEDANWDDFKVIKVGFGEWCCTDTWVGFVAYFYEKELVCWSFQSARKNPIEFSWVSKEAMEKVYKHMQDIAFKEEPSVEIMTEDDYESEVGLGYRVPYASNLLTDNLIEEDTGLPCKVVGNYYKYAFDKSVDKEKYTSELCFHGVDVEFEDGTVKTLYLNKDLIVPWTIDNEAKGD